MKTAIAIVLLSPIAAVASNYGQCILDSVPGLKNQQAFHAAVRVCATKYPGGLRDLEYGAGKGWFFSKYDSPDECVAKEAGGTSLLPAVSEIRNVCRVMYGEPPSKEESGPWMNYR